MRREQTDGRQCQIAAVEAIENDRKSSRRARRLDAAVRSVLGQVEHLCAIREER
jgi:hypothetical protein